MKYGYVVEWNQLDHEKHAINSCLMDLEDNQLWLTDITPLKKRVGIFPDKSNTTPIPHVFKSLFKIRSVIKNMLYLNDYVVLEQSRYGLYFTLKSNHLKFPDLTATDRYCIWKVEIEE